MAAPPTAAAVGRIRREGGKEGGEIDDHAPFIFSVANRHLCQIVAADPVSPKESLTRWPRLSPSIHCKRHGTKRQRDRGRAGVEGRARRVRPSFVCSFFPRPKETPLWPWRGSSVCCVQAEKTKPVLVAGSQSQSCFLALISRSPSPLSSCLESGRLGWKAGSAVASINVGKRPSSFVRSFVPSFEKRNTFYCRSYLERGDEGASSLPPSLVGPFFLLYARSIRRKWSGASSSGYGVTRRVRKGVTNVTSV